MIFDRMENMGNYRGLSRNLVTAIAYLERPDLRKLSAGEFRIDGEEVFIRVSDGSTKDISQGCYEYHRKYMDIQIAIDGREMILLGDGIVKTVQDYREDIGLVQCRESARCVLEPGKFAIFGTGERHMPGISVDSGSDRIRKAVVKVAAGETVCGA